MDHFEGRAGAHHKWGTGDTYSVDVQSGAARVLGTETWGFTPSLRGHQLGKFGWPGVPEMLPFIPPVVPSVYLLFLACGCEPCNPAAPHSPVRSLNW